MHDDSSYQLKVCSVSLIFLVFAIEALNTYVISIRSGVYEEAEQEFIDRLKEWVTSVGAKGLLVLVNEADHSCSYVDPYTGCFSFLILGSVKGLSSARAANR